MDTGNQDTFVVIFAYALFGVIAMIMQATLFGRNNHLGMRILAAVMLVIYQPVAYFVFKIMSETGLAGGIIATVIVDVASFIVVVPLRWCLSLALDHWTGIHEMRKEDTVLRSRRSR